MPIDTRTYRPADAAAVVDLWNLCLPLDPITVPIFNDKVLLDPNFGLDGCRVAVDGERIVGFCHAVVRTTPHPRGFEALLEADAGTGWIIALFVHPDCRRRGLGSRLLSEGQDYISAGGRSRVVLFNYTPNYLLVGLDEAGYPGAREFYERHGFRAGGRIVGMGVNLQGRTDPSFALQNDSFLRSEGVTIEHFHSTQIVPTLAFFDAHFPTWTHYFIDKMAAGHDPDEMVIVKHEDRVIGYCQHRYYHHVERTGPFGIAPDYRGRGAGLAMLFKLLDRMAQKGYKYAWFTGTDEGTANYYAKAGYREIRSHVGMTKEL